MTVAGWCAPGHRSPSGLRSKGAGVMAQNPLTPAWIRFAAQAPNGARERILSAACFVLLCPADSQWSNRRWADHHPLAASNQLFHCGTAVMKVPRWSVLPVEIAVTALFPDPIASWNVMAMRPSPGVTTSSLSP